MTPTSGMSICEMTWGYWGTILVVFEQRRVDIACFYEAILTRSKSYQQPCYSSSPPKQPNPESKQIQKKTSLRVSVVKLNWHTLAS